jgi:very-short-patch-repair endonuclease
VQFRRQVPLLGRYVVDFHASSVGWVVEVDGGYHRDRARADARRDRALERAGYRVLRLSEHLVMRELEMALIRVRAAIGCG